LTKWWADEEGNLCGSLEMPIKVGIVGAAVDSNPTASLNLRLLRVESATELAQAFDQRLGKIQTVSERKALP
jgi:hydroxymethylglutaryl-CoA reductase